jgi:hypothetical protein
MQTMVGADSTLNGCLVTGNGAKTALHNPRLEAPRPPSAAQNVGLHLNKGFRMRQGGLGKGMKDYLLPGSGSGANMA